MSLIEFASSWGLFWRPYSLTLLAAPALSLLGVYAVARRQLFIAAAVSQSAIFGFALFTLVFGARAVGADGSLWGDALVLLFAVGAALVATLGRETGGHGGRLNNDELIAWVFIAAGVGATLILSHAPAGMELARQLQASSVVGARWGDVVLFGITLAAIVGTLILHGRTVVLLLTDPVMAAAIGLRVGAWNLGVTVLSGVAIGMSVRSTGMMFTFGCLVLPVMIAKQLCGEVRTLLVASPLAAVMTAALGLWAAYEWDLPPGQSVVALQSIALAAAVALRGAWSLSAR
jgi:ABC-type Mn2+/Zn2+ transport system permease subunit